MHCFSGMGSSSQQQWYWVTVNGVASRVRRRRSTVRPSLMVTEKPNQALAAEETDVTCRDQRTTLVPESAYVVELSNHRDSAGPISTKHSRIPCPVRSIRTSWRW